MPKIEVDELQLQQDMKLRATVENWMKNPKARRKVMEAQKIVDPKAVIPELDEPDPIDELRQRFDERTAELEKKLLESETARERETRLSQLQATRDAGFAELRKARKYTDEGIKAVEEIMEKKGILDPLDAATIFERDHPPPPPAAPRASGGWNFSETPLGEDPDDKYVDQLLKSGKNGITDMALMSRVNETLNDVRQSRR